VNIQEKLLTEGVVVLPLEDLAFKKEVVQKLKSELQVDHLENIHSVVKPSEINNTRIKLFQLINSIPKWDLKWLAGCRSTVSMLLGPDLLVQTKLNLSIQMPSDDSSQLGIHADTLSGQSPFELVTW